MAICYWNHEPQPAETYACLDGKNQVCARCCVEKCAVDTPVWFTTCAEAGHPTWPTVRARRTVASKLVCLETYWNHELFKTISVKGFFESLANLTRPRLQLAHRFVESERPMPSLAKKNGAVQLLSRRKMLTLLGGGTAAVFLGCRRVKRAGEPSVSIGGPEAAHAAVIPACVVRPEQTEGPYFIDEKLNRSDIRTDPSDGVVKSGVPLHLAFHVSRVTGTTCRPLSGAVVDVWQCDALGLYSDVRDINAGFDTRGKKFLRGYQTTDGKGIAEFLTIYPGWYAGRAVHIHFKIRTLPAFGRAQEFTSQLYFDESITDQVHKEAPYNSKGRHVTTNDADFVFRRGGRQLIPTLTKESHGYAARFGIGLQIS